MTKIGGLREDTQLGLALKNYLDQLLLANDERQYKVAKSVLSTTKKQQGKLH